MSKVLQGEHSAILLTWIRRLLTLKTNLWSFCEWLFYTGFTVYALKDMDWWACYGNNLKVWPVCVLLNLSLLLYMLRRNGPLYIAGDCCLKIYKLSFNCLHAGLIFMIFSQNNLFIKILSGTLSACQTVRDPDQARRSVGSDLGPNCLQRLSADDKSCRWQAKSKEY